MAGLAIGLMSRTSCDGVSAALVNIRSRAFQVLAERTLPYPQPLRQRLLRAVSLTADALSSLNMELGEQMARAALSVLAAAAVPPARIRVIGSHGHTVYHGPGDRVRSTLQLGAPAVIAHRTGIPVVADFRMRDVAAGGEGAPLVTVFDEHFFGRGPLRAMQNLGGIGNVTVVGRGVETMAFDTGPANCLMDMLAERVSRGRQRYDTNGWLALRGRVDHRAVQQLWAHPFFRRPPPKSTGKEMFNGAWLQKVFGRRLNRHPLDVLATVTYFTAYSIAESYHRFFPRRRLREVIVSGGGVHNRTLMDHLSRLLSPVPVRSISRCGLPPQAKEPVAFAFLGLQAIQGRVNHLPQTTGARTACILGALTPGNVHAPD